MRSTRYSAKGSDLFESWFRAFANQLVADCMAELGGSVSALGLCGSFGRGEGAVISAEGEERAYGDIDLFAVAASRGAAQALDSLRRRYEEELGLSIDFNYVFTAADLSRAKAELGIYNLANGHKILWGDEDAIYSGVPLGVFSAPMREEAPRLLLCRGATLLKALRAADGLDAMPDRDLQRRCYHRTALGIGDALLIERGLYAPPVAERVQAYKQLESRDAEVKALRHGQAYEKAAQFKLDPDSLPQAQPAREQLEELVFAWGRAFLIAERRLRGGSWKNLVHYLGFQGLREPAKHGFRDRMSYLFAPAPGFSSSTRNPREALYPELIELLGLTGKQTKGVQWNQRVERFLALHREVR